MPSGSSISTFADQELPVTTFKNRSKNRFSVVVYVDPIEIDPRSHDVANSPVANVENPFHYLLLRLLQ